MGLGGVLEVVLIISHFKGVDERNKVDSLWELVKEIIDHVKYMIILIKEGDYAIDGT
jgi:hypothetical protein